MSVRRGAGGTRWLMAGLLGVFFLQVFTASPLKSPTFDEPAHIGAGLSYWKTLEFKVNPQHPPLLKEIGALPLVLAGVRFPVSDIEWKRMMGNVNPYFQWQLGRDILFDNDPDRILFLARLPFIGLAILLGGLIAAWGCRLLGTTAALGGLLLYCFDPTILAHAPLVATDSGFAAFTLLFFYALWSYLNQRTLKRLLLCGGALGLALGSKFTAVLLVPVAFLLLLGAVRWIPAAVPARASSLVDPFASESVGQRLIWSVYVFLTLLALGGAVVELIYFLPGNPFVYLEGMRRVNADHDPSYLAFMAGRFQPHFYTYYLVCYLLKEPLAAIGLATLGLWAVLRPGGMATLDRAFLLLPPAVLFLGYSIYSDNLGFRYLIPALPFLHLLGGAGLASLLRAGGWWRRLPAVALCVWIVLAGTAIYPDHLSYFNESACLLTDPSRTGIDGGWRCGPLWLDDSNIDWGQGMKQLRTWLTLHPPQGTLMLGYFGSIRPENYGISGIPVTSDDLRHGPQPGLYAVSAHVLARSIAVLRQTHGDGPGNWLLHAPVTAVVGHAYYIYDIPERAAP